MAAEPNSSFLEKLQSFFSVALFIVLAIGVSALTWNFIQALLDKFSSAG